MTAVRTGLVDGDLEAALVVMAVNLLAAVAILPLHLPVLGPATISFGPAELYRQLAQVVVLPMITGNPTRRLLPSRCDRDGFKRLKSTFGGLSSLGVMLIIFVTMTMRSTQTLADPVASATTVVTSLVFYVAIPGAGVLLGRVLLDTDRGIALVYATSMSDFLPRLKSWGTTVTDRAPTSRGSHLVRDGWVMGRASPVPDRDSGLHLPVLSTNGAHPYLGLGSTIHETNGNSWYGLVGFIPRLNSWAFCLSLCNLPIAVAVVFAAEAVPAGPVLPIAVAYVILPPLGAMHMHYQRDVVGQGLSLRGGRRNRLICQLASPEPDRRRRRRSGRRCRGSELPMLERLLYRTSRPGRRLPSSSESTSPHVAVLATPSPS
jgi:hypothetical protein